MSVNDITKALLDLHQEDLFRGHLSNGCKTCEGGEWPCETVELVHRLTEAHTFAPDWSDQ